MTDQVNPTSPLRAALYLRISVKQDGNNVVSHAIEDQETRCRSLCEREGYQIAAVFVDDDISAYKSKKVRPGYNELKSDIAKNKFDVMVFDRLDRLQRDKYEAMHFMELCENAGMTWYSVREGPSKLGDDGNIAFITTAIWGSQAETYSATIGKSNRARNQSKRDDGKPGAGARAFGWDSPGNEANGWHQTIVEAEAELIRIGTEMIISGASAYQAAKVFQESGLKTSRGNNWVTANVKAVLKNWKNAGWVAHADVPVRPNEGYWQAIVSLEDVKTVRAMLSRGRIAGKWKKPTQLCSSIARCHCGLPLMVTACDGLPAYRCSGIAAHTAEPGMKHITIRAALLDPLVRDAVIDSYLHRPASLNAGKGEAQRLGKLYARLDEIPAKRNVVQVGYEAGGYSAQELAKRTAAFDSDAAKIRAEIATVTAESANAAMLAATMNSWVGDQGSAEWKGIVKLGKVVKRDNEGARYAKENWAAGIRDDPNQIADFIASIKWFAFDIGMARDPRLVELRAAVGERFDALSLEERRTLVRALLSVTVGPGRGSQRVAIHPLGVELDPADHAL